MMANTCPRCAKNTNGGYAHTCAPTAGWRKLEDEIAKLQAENADLRKGTTDNGCEIVTDTDGEIWIRNIRAEKAESESEALRKDAELVEFLSKMDDQDFTDLFSDHRMMPENFIKVVQEAIEQAKGGA